MLLKGIRVVDLSRVLAGPFCGQLLADMGADVIKVESSAGDENRLWPPIMPSGQSSNYGSVNRGKRAMTLDMKSEGGQRILNQMIRRADVVTHSFLPDVADRLGLDYEKAKAANPRVVFCSISGYGEHGELRNKAGYDLMVQAFSGSMSTTGYAGTPPVRTGVSFIDMSTGVSAYAAGKGGQIAFMRHLALENARAGVTANTLALGLMSNAGGSDVTAALAKTVPTGRLGTPEDVGAACVFLASNEASWLTGQTIGLNGGNLTS